MKMRAAGAAPLLLALLASCGAETTRPYDHRTVRAVDPSEIVIGPHELRDVLSVKFQDDAVVRQREGRLVSLARFDLAPLDAVLANHPGIDVFKVFARPEADLDRERAEGEARSGEALADLNSFFYFKLPDARQSEIVMAKLLSIPFVERVEPARAPAALP